MRIVVLGLSLSSAWGNGHATTYRALLKGLDQLGHDVVFLERRQPWYMAHQDLIEPEYARLAFYGDVESLDAFRAEFRRADAVIVGSFVPEGTAVVNRIAPYVRGLLCFYDIDTPVTVRALEEDRCSYLDRQLLARFDAYFSFTGGPILKRLEREFGAKLALPLYCSVDADLYRPDAGTAPHFDLGYIGTYSSDRQPLLDRLLLEPARRAPGFRFIVAGAQYPDGIDWPSNVERIEHVPPSQHRAFYGSLRWALNVTRRDMREAGYSPSVRLFEAAACGVALMSDSWPGLNHFFEPSREIVLASGADSVLMALASSDHRRTALGKSARRRVLSDHTGETRARTLVRDLERVASQRAGAARTERMRRKQEPAPVNDVPGEDRCVAFGPQGTKGVTL